MSKKFVFGNGKTTSYNNHASNGGVHHHNKTSNHNSLMHKIANSSNRSSRSNSIVKDFKSSKALRTHMNGGAGDDVDYCNSK
jgi:hypothetical protein